VLLKHGIARPTPWGSDALHCNPFGSGRFLKKRGSDTLDEGRHRADLPGRRQRAMQGRLARHVPRSKGGWLETPGKAPSPFPVRRVSPQRDGTAPRPRPNREQKLFSESVYALFRSDQATD
jgi:hypothetical protein